MTQDRFQFAADIYIAPVDSHVTEPDECRRLSTQNAALLARLQRGPATNRELAGLSLKYTSRISDLRAAGHVITVKRHPRGLSIYTLESK